MRLRIIVLLILLVTFPITSCMVNHPPPQPKQFYDTAVSYDVRGMGLQERQIATGLAIDHIALALVTPELQKEYSASHYQAARILWGRPAGQTAYLPLRLYPGGDGCLKTLDVFQSVQPPNGPGRLRLRYPGIGPQVEISYDGFMCLQVWVEP